VPQLRHLPTRVADVLAGWDEGDPQGFAEVALQELTASVRSIREYSELLETSFIADELRRLELHRITREIRAQADLVGHLIDAAFQSEAS